MYQVNRLKTSKKLNTSKHIHTHKIKFKRFLCCLNFKFIFNVFFLLHRFGPLVWRTSKERKKTKIHRRDKCNSGDSGIQVELENDDQLVVYEAESLVSLLQRISINFERKKD